MCCEYFIFVLIGLTQIYCCNGGIELADGILKRQGRAAEPQFTLHRRIDDFTNANVVILDEPSLQGRPTDRIITTQQLNQQLYGQPNNQYDQQQKPQTMQRFHINSAPKPRGNQQAHNSRQLQFNGHNNNNNGHHNNNGIGNNKQNKNRMLQEFSGQVGNMQKHNRNNGNHNHHNSYQKIEYNTGHTRNGAIFDTNFEMNAKPTISASFTRPAVDIEWAMHTPTTKSVTPVYITQPTNQPFDLQNINPKNNLFTEIISHTVTSTLKTPQSTEYISGQFRRNIPDNPFLDKEMSQNAFKQNPFLANQQTNSNNQQNKQSDLDNQTSQNLMVLKPTVANPYALNPFLQNTKIPDRAKQPPPTKVPAIDPIQSPSQNVPPTNGTASELISTTPPGTTYPTSKATTVSAELSRLIRNEAVIFPDSIYLPRTTPNSEHILDIRR